MKLTGHQIQQIRDALLDAYSTRDSLRMMVRIELGDDLEAIAGGENQRVMIFNLLSWAERNGRVDALITGAYNQMPGNPALKQLMTEWRALVPPGVEPSVTSPAAALSRGSGPASIDLFLSYSRKDSDAMRKVLEPLREAGLSVWTDEGLKPGTQSWQDAITEALGQAQAMVVLLSPNAKTSQWVNNEIGYAQSLRKRIFPILVSGDEATAVPISLINTQWVDGRQRIDQAVRNELLPTLRIPLKESIRRPPPKSPRQIWLWLGLAAVLLAAIGVWSLAGLGGFQIVRVTATLSPSTENRITPSPASSPGTIATDTEAIEAASLPTETASATNTPTPAPSSTATAEPTTTTTATDTSTAEATSTPTPLPTATLNAAPIDTATLTPTRTPVEPSIRKFSPPRDGKLHIEGFAEPGADVEVSINDATAGIIKADDAGRWQLDVQIDTPGEYVVRVLTSGGSAENFVLIQEPTPTATSTIVATPSPASTPEPTNTLVPAPTATPTRIPTRTPTPKPKPTAIPTTQPTAIPTATSSFTAPPAAGERRTNPKDGAEYVYVPAGPFKMGSDEGDWLAADDEKPQTTVNVAGFWIMRTEVTNGHYKRCVAAGVCTAPNNERWKDPAYVDHPVTNVDWQEANDYAKWAGGRLPTEAEWEKACRGTDGRIYPWGDSVPTADLANFNNNVRDTTPVGKYSSQGDSPYSLVDMAGNVWEWTSSQYQAYPYNATDGRENLEGDATRMLRGGSWYDHDDRVRCPSRRHYPPDSGVNVVGFRVVTP